MNFEFGVENSGESTTVSVNFYFFKLLTVIYRRFFSDGTRIPNIISSEEMKFSLSSSEEQYKQHTDINRELSVFFQWRLNANYK